MSWTERAWITVLARWWKLPYEKRRSVNCLTPHPDKEADRIMYLGEYLIARKYCPSNRRKSYARSNDTSM